MKPLRAHDTGGISRALGNREPFFTNTGSLVGYPGPAASTGQLPADWTRTLEARRHAIDYTIASYFTPIAWHDKETGRWVIPDERYSVTTSKHQGRVRAALELTGEEVEVT